MFVHRDDTVQGQSQLARDGLDDTEVGLVWNQPIDIRLLHTVRRERLFDDVGKGGDRCLEQLGPLHLQTGVLIGVAADPAGNSEYSGVRAVRMEMRGKDARFLPGLQHHGTRTVAEQHSRVAILPIDQVR